ncbi:MAG: DUF4197 domain-containing protein [Rhodothalassiaceae bacterium]
MRVLLMAMIAMLAMPASAQSLFDKAKTALTSDKTARSVSDLSEADIAAGLREALGLASDEVSARLGLEDAFLKDEKIHIPLPKSLRRVAKALNRAGLGSLTEDLEMKLNRAAEAAAPKAKTLLLDSITTMSIEDAASILKGPEDAATQYLRRTAGEALLTEFRPIVHETLLDVGALASYDKTIAAYRDLPYVPDVRADLESYASEKALDGLFYHIAKEEALIRKNPLGRGSDLLAKVFGGE